MLLLFLRHAEAVDYADSDFERHLTPKGLEQADRVGKFLVRTGIIPDFLLSSPLVRARQTAEGVSRRLDGKDILVQPWLACGMSPAECMKQLGAFPKQQTLLLVGHEPDFSATIATLIGTSPEKLHIRKASLTGIETNALSPGSGTLEFCISCRLM
jgi:phosphohistidine phosphatase